MPWLENATQKKSKELGPTVIRYVREKASDEQLQSMMEQCKLWFGTLTEGDTVHIPSGYIVCDRVKQAQDVIGLRIGVCTEKDVELLKWHNQFQPKPEIGYLLASLPEQSQLPAVADVPDAASAGATGGPATPTLGSAVASACASNVPVTQTHGSVVASAGDAASVPGTQTPVASADATGGPATPTHDPSAAATAGVPMDATPRAPAAAGTTRAQSVDATRAPSSSGAAAGAPSADAAIAKDKSAELLSTAAKVPADDNSGTPVADAATAGTPAADAASHIAPGTEPAKQSNLMKALMAGGVAGAGSNAEVAAAEGGIAGANGAAAEEGGVVGVNFAEEEVGNVEAEEAMNNKSRKISRKTEPPKLPKPKKGKGKGKSATK